MNLRIKRRRFGQLVVAGATSAAVAQFGSKTVAQQPQLIIYGVRLNSTNPTAEDLFDISPGIVIIPLDIATGIELTPTVVPPSTVGNKAVRNEIANKAIFTQPRERLTGFTALLNGTFIIPSTFSSKKGDSSRLVFFDKKISKFQKGLKLSGFKKRNTTIESLLATKDGKLLSVISLNGGMPPFDLAVINPQTGKVTSGSELAFPELPVNQRFSNLVQIPDGSIYATNLDHEGVTSLVQLDLNNKSIVTGRGKIIRLSALKFNGKTLGDDLLDLAVSPIGQIFALADPSKEGTNSLFNVDVKTGEMQLLRKFEVDKITFAV